MCGICGIWGEVGQISLERMVTAMHHRGPDDFGILIQSEVGLGMTRLSILDLSSSGHQPMCTPDERLWIVYNGEVYNFQTERATLEARGYSFRSTSDTEVVLRMYECYGERFLERLRGMFALAILDRRKGPGKEKLLLARDQMGIKPLLYARIGGQFIFASEIKALLASGLIQPEIDPIGLRLLLTYGSVYQPYTLLRGVKMLPPAHLLVLEAGGVERVEAYWRIGRGRFDGLQDAPYETLVDQLASLLEELVQLQMISDVPLGAFLSGGVDSSIVTAIMARTSGNQIKTFSVGFESESETIDESADALATARFLGTEHHAVLVRGSDVRDRLAHVISGLDQPSVDGVNSYFVSWAARQGGLTVAVSGTGGDELFAGYPWFIDMAVYGNAPHSLFQNALAQAIRQPVLDPFLHGKLGRLVHRTRSRGGFVSRYADLYRIFGVAGAQQLIRPGLRSSAQAGRAPYFDLRYLDEVPEGSPVERVSALCLRGYTNNQLLRDIDAMSMIHSLEVRVPYLDPILLDFAMSLPDLAKMGTVKPLSRPSHTMTYRESGAKRILIDVGMRYLPPGYDHQPKRGFAMPFTSWLKGPLQPILMDTLSEERLRTRGLLDVAAGLTVRDDFLAGRISWAQPWLLMVLELWCQQVLDPGGRFGMVDPGI